MTDYIRKASLTILIATVVALSIAYVKQPETPIKAPVEAVERRTDIEQLITALIAIESNGDDSAIGDGGLAVGCLQIHPIMVRDINRILGRQYINCAYIYKDRHSRTKSIEMCKIYFGHYCRDMSNEHKARCWNGGPNGWKKESTKPYWAKVKARLERE